jgi:predicted DsbA family dithiol-disulfide isomerase
MIEQLLDNNMETIKVIYKHFPLRKHKQAKPAAYAAIAADNQGMFQMYYNELFSNSKRLDDPDLFMEIAKQFEFDIDRFSKDMKDQETKNKVQKDLKDGIKAGVTGIPAVFINGRRLKKHSVAAAQKIIDDELKKFSSDK